MPDRIKYTHHAAGMITERITARVHQPAIWITQTVHIEAGYLLPGG